MGDNMMLVYIQDRVFLTKVIRNLDLANIFYTTDISDSFEYILVADMSRKTRDFIKKNSNSKIIFMTELEEYKMYDNMMSNSKKSKSYMNTLTPFLNGCYKVITSNLYIKKMLSKNHKNIYYIPCSLPDIAISKNNKEIFSKYNIPSRKKKIVIIDILYKHIDALFLLSEKYPKYHFIYVGYDSDYNLTARTKNFKKMLGDNITYIKYIDLNIFSDICKVSDVVIYYESFTLDREYLYIPILFKKVLMVEDILWYQDYLISSKNAYLFKNNNILDLKLSKILEHRVMNLTENAYMIVENCDLESTLKKYRDCL